MSVVDRHRLIEVSMNKTILEQIRSEIKQKHLNNEEPKILILTLSEQMQLMKEVVNEQIVLPFIGSNYQFMGLRIFTPTQYKDEINGTIAMSGETKIDNNIEEKILKKLEDIEIALMPNDTPYQIVAKCHAIFKSCYESTHARGII